MGRIPLLQPIADTHPKGFAEAQLGAALEIRGRLVLRNARDRELLPKSDETDIAGLGRPTAIDSANASAETTHTINTSGTLTNLVGASPNAIAPGVAQTTIITGTGVIASTQIITVGATGASTGGNVQILTTANTSPATIHAAV